MFCLFFFSSRIRHTSCGISDWSSDVCSSDLAARSFAKRLPDESGLDIEHPVAEAGLRARPPVMEFVGVEDHDVSARAVPPRAAIIEGLHAGQGIADGVGVMRSEEHTSELQSLMRISYAVFCLKNNNKQMYDYQNTRN